MLGQGFGCQRFGGGNDRATQRQHRQFNAAGAGGQQQVFALDTLAIDLDLLAVEQLGPAMHNLDSVFFQQGGDPGGQAVDDAVLPGHALADVQARRSHADAQRRGFGVAGGLVVLLGHVDQCLGRDAADVQASAAQRLALDQHRGYAQLPGADGRDIAARAAADDQQGGL